MATTKWWQYPARLLVLVFAAAVLVGTVLLALPLATEGPASAPLLTALFTATSAVCVTGLIIVDTPVYWSTFGEVVLIGLVQLGGLGIMTLASVLALVVSRRLGLRMQLSAQAETGTLNLGDVRALVGGVIRTSLLFEAVTAVILVTRFLVGYDEPWSQALRLGLFHAVAAFNNAGFALFSDNLESFSGDPWIVLPVVVAATAGGLGFPVLLELWRRMRTPRRWSLHVKVTLITSGALAVLGTLMVTTFEWSNPATLGLMGVPEKLMNGFFHGMMPRSAGFNTVAVGEMEQATLLGTSALMFIGGGSAGTAGGIKVTTFAVLLFVLLAEVRGHPSTHVAGRRVPLDVQRQALAVALIGVAVVILSTVYLLLISSFPLEKALFEVTSAFGVVGLSTGITADLPPTGQALLVLLMFAGRLGPITLAAALALREKTRRYELPEERPIIG
ncbi:TrkH family potassium uptake protein [Actinoalloteichus caeruleus]|uniref:Potassium uptake protein, TrkH family n=1 Tax=Actinoalloteichus caeruleus DSM 43889 TaxID=1120930 RepID=A0ABT1JHP8_ACTCY|nr:potassium transporter TrkG [Actinoalloteichus caeruleus]MCP2331693.1 potassium uptake protein, TrkH family [Actinoalloteichus caeruleus DSM 43889]